MEIELVLIYFVIHWFIVYCNSFNPTCVKNPSPHLFIVLSTVKWKQS